MSSEDEGTRPKYLVEADSGYNGVIGTYRLIVKVETNFDCVCEYSRVFGAPWNAEMVECASHRRHGSSCDSLAEIGDSVKGQIGFCGTADDFGGLKNASEYSGCKMNMVI